MQDSSGKFPATYQSSESLWQACGFQGSPARAWAPQDLKLLLQLHAERGATYKPPDYHSGYNEVILSSKKVNRALPFAIEAFFVVDGQSSFRMSDPGSHVVDMRQAHRDFLNHYQLTSDQVPLLNFRPSNWDEPFTQF